MRPIIACDHNLTTHTKTTKCMSVAISTAPDYGLYFYTGVIFETKLHAFGKKRPILRPGHSPRESVIRASNQASTSLFNQREQLPNLIGLGNFPFCICL